MLILVQNTQYCNCLRRVNIFIFINLKYPSIKIQVSSNFTSDVAFGKEKYRDRLKVSFRIF